MKLQRGKALALGTMAAALGVAGFAAVASRDLALEWWSILRLSSDDAETRMRAAEDLGKRRSSRAVPYLLKSQERYQDLAPWTRDKIAAILTKPDN